MQDTFMIYTDTAMQVIKLQEGIWLTLTVNINCSGQCV